MFRYALAGLAMATLVGCSSGGGMSMPFASKGEDRAQLAAYAASTHYPGDVKPSSNVAIQAHPAKYSVPPGAAPNGIFFNKW